MSSIDLHIIIDVAIATIFTKAVEYVAVKVFKIIDSKNDTWLDGDELN